MTKNDKQQYGAAILCALLFVSVLCAYVCFRNSERASKNIRYSEYTPLGRGITTDQLVFFGTRNKREHNKTLDKQ